MKKIMLQFCDRRLINRIEVATVNYSVKFENEALWITSYLDQDMIIGRGASGNLFVFCR
ncbi:MAG: hypothetical protein AAGF83_00560 [Cyanobacteria bacterium P01_G01_bin.67]